MKRPVLFAAWMAAVLAGAAALRLAKLDNRPMHCDEAVQAIKFGRLLEHDDYVYDPREYHGPSLHFLMLPIARLAGVRKLSEASEVHVRLLPAIFGLVLVGLVWALRDELGCCAALCAATLTAVSPAMVFYSRYYIQEMLLVCFSFAALTALWRLDRAAAGGSEEAVVSPRRLRARQMLWLSLLGSCIGMMHVCKETCVIALFAGFLAAVPTLGGLRRLGAKRMVVSGLVAALAAACVSALFFSSFGRNPRGVIDSATAYFYYFGRASGEGVAGRHVQWWDYYLRILFWWRRGGGPVWSEASIAAFALAGLAAAALGKGLPSAHLPMARFLSIYTLVMTVVYSSLPYKTPWCALGFLHGMILLAGIGVTVLVRVLPAPPLKAAAVVLAAAAVGHLSWQAWRASFAHCADPGNPYVYAHTTRDVPLLAQRIEALAARHPDGEAMHIQVICPDHDYWPLPWYFRRLSRVGWFDHVAGGPAAPLMVVQPQMEGALVKKLFEASPPGQRRLYVPLPPEKGGADWQLRPRVPLRVFVRLDLWEAYHARRAGGVALAEPVLELAPTFPFQRRRQ